ncbi:hypothetical protein BDW68DRAFT_69139 [Aspergillus falconensis]
MSCIFPMPLQRLNYPMYLQKTGKAYRNGRLNGGTDEMGKPIWCAKPFYGFYRLVLAGDPQGESYSREGGGYSNDRHSVDDIIAEAGGKRLTTISIPRPRNANMSEDKDREESEGDRRCWTGCSSQQTATTPETTRRSQPTTVLARQSSTLYAPWLTSRCWNRHRSTEGAVYPETEGTVRRLKLEDVLHIPRAVCNGFNFVAYHRQHGGDCIGGPDTDGDWCRDYGTDPDGHPLLVCGGASLAV